MRASTHIFAVAAVLVLISLPAIVTIPTEQYPELHRVAEVVVAFAFGWSMGLGCLLRRMGH